jgi:cytochrome bd ubiquinol oxidase subunit I
MTPLILSRMQFAFTISYHIIFPSFSIGLAAWLTVLEGMHLTRRNAVYRTLFDFWLKIFAVAFGMGVVSGIVMGVEFGTNWSRLSTASGPIQGPLLAYESFTAFALEASFFGVLLFGRSRLTPVLYFLSVAMVALGTSLSAFWIMVNNSWMQAPTGYLLHGGVYEPRSWAAIVFNPVAWVRFPHMLIASYLTGAFCVAATGAWCELRRIYQEEGRVMLRMGLYLAAILMPLQLFIGHLNGDYVHEKQPAKFAAIEARWHDEQPAAEVLIALPDGRQETNRFELKIPVLGSLIATMRPDSKEVGLTDFARRDRPPVAIPFFAFRVMVGCGLAMMAVAWIGSALVALKRLHRSRLMQWAIFLCWPLPWVAILTGWFTAEVGRQPWTIYGLMRTADAVTPTLTAPQAVTSLLFFVCIHGLIFSFGTFYIYHLLRRGPAGAAPSPSNPKRPLAVTNEKTDRAGALLEGFY